MNLRMGKMSDFECGMIRGARLSSSSISEKGALLGLSQTTVSRVYGATNKKHSVRGGKRAEIQYLRLLK